MKAETVRRRVIYHGRVQGVGFRAMVYEIASRYPVSGFVRNLSDGTVEMIVEGSPDQIGSLMAEVRGQFPRNITRVDEAAYSEPDEFTGSRSGGETASFAGWFDFAAPARSGMNWRFAGTFRRG